MTVDRSPLKQIPMYPKFGGNTFTNDRMSNVSRLPEPIERYLSFSLGQNGNSNPSDTSLDNRSKPVNIEPNLPFTIYTLGHFTILKKDQDLQAAYKGQNKPIEMLKALIALGGNNVGEMRLCEALWPDTDGDVAHSAFSVTLHRLRKLTGHDALELNDSRLTLNPNYCWVDVWVCEQLLNNCKHALSNKQVDTNYAMRCIESAMQLYNGPFLGNEDEQPWYIMFRQRLHSKMLRSLLNMCAHLESIKRCDQALDLYHKGIELEPLAEEFYFRLMRCLASFDRKAEAISTYIRCCNIFKTTLKVGPSRATEGLYKSLLN